MCLYIILYIVYCILYIIYFIILYVIWYYIIYYIIYIYIHTVYRHVLTMAHVCVWKWGARANFQSNRENDEKTMDLGLPFFQTNPYGYDRVDQTWGNGAHLWVSVGVSII